MEWMCDFQEEEVKMSSLLPFKKTGGMSELHPHEMTACVVLLWLNKTMSSLPHFLKIGKKGG